MAAPYLKFVTQFGTDAGYGFSEVHYKQNSAESPDLQVQMNNFILSVGAARQTILGEDCYIVGFRVSYKNNNFNYATGRRQKLAGAAGHPGSAPAVSLAISMKNADFSKKKIIHLRGFWDSVELDETYRGDLDSDWTARLTSYIEALKGGYGWPSINPATSAKGNVLSYSVGMDGLVTFTLDPDTPMPLATVGKNVFVAFSKFHNSRSILNRTLQVTVESQVLLKTQIPVGAVQDTSKGHFNYRDVAFVAYNASDTIALGERRMGKPLNRRPGRSRATVLS